MAEWIEKNEQGNGEVLSKAYLQKRAKHKLVVFTISLLIVICICMAVYQGVHLALFEPASFLDSSPVSVTIEKSSSVSSIAQTLYEKGLIRNKTVFQFLVAFYNQGSSLKAGDYAFSKTMTPRERFTVAEGTTVKEEAAKMASEKIFESEEAFLNLAKSGEGFLEYSFISEIPEATRAKRQYLLEGYIFPDTYEIYQGASEQTILAKQVAQFNKVFTTDYYVRAEQLGMTVDQVVTLASIIQKEGKPADFNKISAVLLNRLKKGMKLESCATVQYALGIKRFNLTASDIASTSPYNTYKYAGYPAGPICNPGEEAIKAVLYPDESFIKDGYLYFCNKDPESGELVFSKTLDEHQNNVEQYRPSWEAYDKAKGY